MQARFPGPSVDALVARAAAAADWVLSSRQLRALGLSEDQIAHRVRIGVLHHVHHGVYCFGRPRPDFLGRCRAALLACGPASAIGHESAARVWGVGRSSGPIHVIAPRSREGHPGLRVHRPRRFSFDDDVVERSGVRVTTVGRTLLDLAAGQPHGRVERLIHEAGVQRVLDAVSIYDSCRRAPRHRGRGRLEAALHAEIAPTRSGLERAFLALCRRGGLSAPVVNAHLGTSAGLEEVDFHWPEARIVVEVDGARYHASRWRQRRDAEKAQGLPDAGWTVLRVSELELTLAPAGVLADIHALRGVGGRTGPAAGFARPPGR